MASNGA